MNNGLHIFVENSARLRLLLAPMALLLAAAIQTALSFSGAELPQKSVDSILTMISDDTRQVVSQSMMSKVDEYFHGGVKAEGGCEGVTGESHAHEGAEAHQCDDHCDHEPQHLTTYNPIAWINARIHAQEHRHLTAERSVELLPWVVAASRASPHNIQAYEVGSYILNRMSEQPQIAVDFIQEGIKNNPENPELEVTLGEMCFNTLKDQQQAAAAFERALTKSLARSQSVTEDELFLRLKIYFYLGVIAKERHDISKLRDVTQRALELKKENVMAQSLATWLGEEENRGKE